MKTKLKTAIIAISAFLYVADSYAQDYYAGKTQVGGDGFTLNVENFENFSYHIFNESNVLYNQYPTFLDGTTPDPEMHWSLRAYVMDEEQRTHAFRESFTAEETEALKNADAKIGVTNRINPATGKIMEVSFSIRIQPVLYSLPPERFYMLEQKLMRYVTFEVPPPGNLVNFVIASRDFRFRDLVGEGTYVPEGPGTGGTDPERPEPH